MIHIGFTGTRHGMTFEQGRKVIHILRQIFEQERVDDEHRSQDWTAHHGCCIGADLEFHAIARDHSAYQIIGHPGPEGVLEDQRGKYDELRAPATHLKRNREIVSNVYAMIAAPPTEQRQVRGGTWYTVDYSIKVARPILVVTPAGTVVPGPVPWPWKLPT